MIFFAGFTTAASAGEEITKPALPEGKQTTLGLFVTSTGAYEKWRADPNAVKIFDVRTLEEYIFIGHAPMAWNIPLMSQTHDWDAEKGHFAMQPNPDFLSQVKEVAGPSDTLMVMCHSGGRSAHAVNLIAEAGYTHTHFFSSKWEGEI